MLTTLSTRSGLLKQVCTLDILPFFGSCMQSQDSYMEQKSGLYALLTAGES